MCIRDSTQPTTGCLHDYQLSPQELISLETADCLLINGAGMESFLDKVMDNYPELNIVTASDGIDMMEGEGHDHDHDHAEGDVHNPLEEETVNPHVWVSISRYMQYVENIRDGLIAADPAHTQQYQDNASAYLEKIQRLKDEMHEALDHVSHRDIITFHEEMCIRDRMKGCDAIHPGFGVLSENAEFAEICDQCGLTFIGPGADSIRLLGDKARAKDTMKACGVPTIPGSDGELTDFTQTLRSKRNIC